MRELKISKDIIIRYHIFNELNKSHPFVMNKEEIDNNVYKYITNFVNPESSKTNIISSNRTQFDIDNKINYEAIINLHRINDIRRINKFMENINTKLLNGGKFICCAETKNLRKERILKKFIRPFNYIYYILDFIFKRIFPKLPITKKIYFFLTQGRNRVLSKTEVLGRIYSCGFEIISEKKIGSFYYFITKKIKDPVFDNSPTYGPFIKLKRIGKDNKLIKVYKLRTMHPYSEYIQDYVYKRNNLDKGGKFKDDFRISTIGKIFRKLWIDELPMFINVFKGEMKIVGVRPLSEHYFNLYPETLRTMRTKYKPGLIPPFYVDMPDTLDDIIASELKYLSSYKRSPFKTDLSYFVRALYNIIIKRKRSK